MKSGTAVVRGGKNELASTTVPFYTYAVDTVRRSIQLVTGALTSLRGAAKCLDIFSDVCTAPIPSHTAIQNWILQYGLSELMRPIERRQDWVFILDHTIEFGRQKCLVVLGTTLEEVCTTKGAITHHQLRTLLIDISHNTNSQRVYASLNVLVDKTGIPAQIVSDHGSDLKKAIEEMCEKYPRIRFTYDITHKCGLVLKHALGRDILWNRFLEGYSYTKRKCVHSGLAFLAPSKLQDKSRWMNLDTCVDWATKIIAFGHNLQHNIETLHLEKKGFAQSFRNIFGWLDAYTQPLQNWSDILRVIAIARDEVKSNGLRQDTAQRFSHRLGLLQLPNHQSSQVLTVAAEIDTFLRQQTEAIPAGQKLLGTSDIIESVFAKYKTFSARTPMKGVGKTVLTIPVFLSTITPQKVAEALGACPMKKVTLWLQTNIGRSVFAQRTRAFNICGGVPKTG